MPAPPRTEALAGNNLAPCVVGDLGGMLTILMGNLKLLSRQPLVPRTTRHLARASFAARRTGQLLWQPPQPDALAGMHPDVGHPP